MPASGDAPGTDSVVAPRELRPGREKRECLEGCQPWRWRKVILRFPGGCDVPRGLQIPGWGMQAACYKEVGWKEVGCVDVPPWGVTLPESQVSSPAARPCCGVRPHLQPVPITIDKEMHVERLQDLGRKGWGGFGWLPWLINPSCYLESVLLLMSW